jgi:DNA processing protein
MAVGIDGLAQSACVRAGGKSFALLGSGVDVCYPNENRELYELLKTNGGIISENPPGTSPRRQLFPMRNRLISAFCDALLVIEARKRSGTLITVDMALEQGKDILSVK